MTMIKIVSIPTLMLAVVGLTACNTQPVQTGSSTLPANMGPSNFDGSGVVRCSVGAATYNHACGFRILDKPSGGAELWISNIAYNDKVVFRVLDYEKGKFTTRGGDSLDYSRSNDNWLVTANGREHYKIPPILSLYNTGRSEQQSRTNQAVSTVAGVGYLLNSFADGYNKQNNSYNYRSPQMKIPQPQFGNTSFGSGYSYKSSSGTKYKYDLSNPADRVLYKADAASQVRDRTNPRINIDRRTNQYGGGASW